MAKKSPDKIAIEALQAALDELVRAGENASPTVIRRIRAGLAEHVAATEIARAATDPIAMPETTFDPSDPKTVGRMVALALLAQSRVPLSSIKPTYGSGIYAIYYEGDHPFYREISGTETPIYVGKADPMSGDASNPREQGAKLSGRLIEHAGTIERAQDYASANTLPSGLFPIALEDFTCRRLVCATNAQLVAEKHLINMFLPLWNSETKACWGMSKHGDAATTRKNKRSPWDVVHPGRGWALHELLEDSLTIGEIKSRIDGILLRIPPKTDHASLLEEVLAAFRQEGPLVDAAAVPPVIEEDDGES
ncbi:Eco29kI family restriction endonuclease [Novosphingobium naphthalenivorans]|uniref:Eco29kI family restriction endonuclease n=1 Tax=Novosphingobium naphthalenivorans TaxID=273168 RepID=UPI000B120BD1|nr:Eco29kI family restriction endonuclease [Novosphingobium naphthalenivorans]